MNEIKTELSRNDKMFRVPAWIQLFIGVVMDYFLVLSGKYVSIPVNIHGEEAKLPAFTTVCISIFLVLQLYPTVLVYINRKLNIPKTDDTDAKTGI